VFIFIFLKKIYAFVYSAAKLLAQARLIKNLKLLEEYEAKRYMHREILVGI
jgi:hypothetical protein